MIKNLTFHGRTKNIEIRFNFIISKIEPKEVEFIYLSTNKMIADILIKSLPKAKFNFCKDNLALHPIISIKRKLVRIEEVTNLKKSGLK